jgi:AcrR family transcriptional regulator
MTAPPASRRRRAARGDGDRLREDILVATAELLAHMGSDEALSLRAVAREVGVSAPSVYLHFPDKESLLLAVAAELFGEVERALDSAAAEADDAVEAVVSRARAYVEWGLAHPGQYKVLYEGALWRRLEHPAQQALGQAALVSLVADVERASASGALSPDLDAEHTARLLWQAAHGVTSIRVNKPNAVSSDAAEDIEQMVRALLRAGPPQPR